MIFVELNEQEYKEYADHSPYRNLWQSTEMCHFREQNGWKAHYLALKEENQILAACALVSYSTLFGYQIFQAMRGFLIDYNDTKILQEFHTHLIAYMKQQKGIYFSMDPYISYQEHDKNGNVVHPETNQDALISELKRLGYQHDGLTVGTDEEHSEPRWMFLLPLDHKSDEELLKNMNQLTRRSIKKTQRPGFVLKELKREELHAYQALMSHTAKRKGFTERSLTYYEKMYDIFHDMDMLKYWAIILKTDEYLEELHKELQMEEKKIQQIAETLEKNPENIKSLNKLKAAQDTYKSCQNKIQEAMQMQKEKGKEVLLSGAMFFLYGDEVIYLTGGSYEETMHFSAQYRLQWEMISYAAQHGYHTYNFYGISGVFDEKGKDGVLTFKQGFDGKVQELIGTFTYTLHPVLYFLYHTLGKIKHLNK